MARLFIKHKPVEAYVAQGLSWNSFKVDKRHLTGAGLSVGEFSIDTVYVCIVHEGRCFAAREFHQFKAFGGEIVSIACAPFDTELGKQMILADMVLS